MWLHCLLRLIDDSALRIRNCRFWGVSHQNRKPLARYCLIPQGAQYHARPKISAFPMRRSEFSAWSGKFPKNGVICSVRSILLIEGSDSNPVYVYNVVIKC